MAELARDDQRGMCAAITDAEHIVDKSSGTKTKRKVRPQLTP
jgi:hypothetical protein